jgi:N-methylhydantoinase B
VHSIDGHVRPPKGVRGGHDGSAADAFLVDQMGAQAQLDMVATVELEPGQRLVSISSGGGGYGDPYTREPASVCHDVEEGLVSREAAARDYGVVLVVSAGRLQVDEMATARLRAI